MFNIYGINIIHSLEECKLQEVLKKIHNYKLEKYKNYILSEDKNRCLYGELLINYILKKNFNQSYFNKKIFLSSYGKPYLVNSNFHFNISHSGNWVVCCVSKQQIGIDIEKVTNFNWKNISSRFFSESENKYITNSSNPIHSFFRFWTMKESFIKYHGISLDSNIKKIIFCPLNDNLSKIVSDTTAKNILSFYIDHNYMISFYANKNKYNYSFTEVSINCLINSL